MTLRVQIKHCENQIAPIRVMRGGVTLATLSPGGECEANVWLQAPLTIEEVLIPENQHLLRSNG